MRIGAVVQDDVGEYIHGIVQGMIELSSEDHFILYGCSSMDVGEAVPKGSLRGPRILQTSIMLPWIVRRDKLNALLCTESVAPFVPVGCPVVSILQDVSRWSTRWGIRCTKGRGASFVVSKPELMKRLCTLGVDPDRVRYIGASIPSRFHTWDPQSDEALEVIQRYNIPSHFILMKATSDNAVRVIRAFGLIKEFHGMPYYLVIMGRLQGCLQIEIGSSGHRDTIKVIDVDNDDWPIVYSLATLFITAEEDSDSGTDIAEAMSCGCPVICSLKDAQGVAGVAGESVDPFDVKDIARGIRDVLRNPDLQDDMRRLGLDQSRGFTQDQSARSIISLLDEAPDKATLR